MEDIETDARLFLDDSGQHHDDIGAVLREARKRRGLSLEQLSQTTKIGVTFLERIEQNQIEKLPDPVFSRGFVRAYAGAVGLDQEDIVRRYVRQFDPVVNIVEPVEPEPDETSQHDRRNPLNVFHDAWSHIQELLRFVRLDWPTTGALIVTFAFGYYAGSRSRSPAAAVHQDPPGATTEQMRPPSVLPQIQPPARDETGTAGSSSEAAVATDGYSLNVEIRPRGSCWLSVTADGTRVVYRVVEAGERFTFPLHEEAVLRIGDPAAFAFSINGRPGRLLGRPREAMTIRITRQNYRELLQQ